MSTPPPAGIERYVDTNGIRLHYVEYYSDEPLLLLMHGLTANAHAFDGLIAGGLHPAFHLICVDLRGRGKSDQPPAGYTMTDHAKDILGLLDAMQLKTAILGGHSFGALLALYIAANNPDRVKRLILMDAAARMHPNTKEMLGPSLSRLGKTFPSFDDYLEKIKAAPYMDTWDEQMRSYYEADVIHHQDGAVTPIPRPPQMVEAVNGVLSCPWLEFMPTIEHETLLLNGTGIYSLGAALLPEENARETVSMMKHCDYVKVPGNHQTMLYGEGAKEIVAAVKPFVSKSAVPGKFAGKTLAEPGSVVIL